jgi:hypothetical protein
MCIDMVGVVWCAYYVMMRGLKKACAGNASRKVYNFPFHPFLTLNESWNASTSFPSHNHHTHTH